MGYTVTQIECHACGSYMLDTGRFLECDECGLVEEKTNEKIIRSIKAEYPNAKITETDNQIIVDIEIILEKPVHQIKLSGVVDL